MARIIPPTQQQQQMNQLNAMRQTLQGLSAQLQATQARQAPAPAPSQPAPTQATIQRGDTLGQLARTHGTTVSQLMTANPQITNPNLIIAGRALNIPGAIMMPTPASTPVIQRVPDAPPVAPTPAPTPAQMQEERMRALIREHEVALRTPTPEPVGLQPQERQLFTDERANLRARYDAALQTLRRQQEQDRARLIGRYAAAGFTEPGVIAGPMAGEPGIVTRALQETGEVHARNIAGLERGGAEDILAITRAEQEAERRGRVEAAEQFARRQDALVRNLERQMEIARPEQFTLNNRVFQRDRATGAVTDITPQTAITPEVFTLEGRRFQRNPVTEITIDITPPEALRQQVNVERGGRRWRVTLDGEGREIGAIDLGPAEVVQAAPDERLSPAQAVAWGVPFGTTEGQLADIFNSPTPPQWFVNRAQAEANQRRVTYLPNKIQELWNAERARVAGGQGGQDEDETKTPTVAEAHQIMRVNFQQYRDEGYSRREVEEIFKAENEGDIPGPIKRIMDEVFVRRTP